MGLQVQKKREARLSRHKRVRKKVHGTTERPRLSVFRSNLYLYAQIIDDTKGVTLAMASSQEKEIAKKKSANNIESAKKLGLLLAKRAKEKKITQVVFDKGGYLYHGKIKALADAAREGGLVF
ncbi:MAG: 50S ribosomal protein L18 [Nitrospirae bacterium]|nr:50S ribosomal protein L18 [Nitrospirota bacterium]MBI3351750.1 50S ribosomal protein L18 [Nitrospirota bacterium]